MSRVLTIIRTAAVLLLLCVIAIAPATEAVSHGPAIAQSDADHDHDHDRADQTHGSFHHGQAHHEGAEHDHTIAVILPTLASLSMPNTAGHLTTQDCHRVGLGADRLRRPPRQAV